MMLNSNRKYSIILAVALFVAIIVFAIKAPLFMIMALISGAVGAVCGYMFKNPESIYVTKFVDRIVHVETPTVSTDTKDNQSKKSKS